MHTVSVKLADDIKARLDRIAAEEGTTPHAVMVSAISEEVERREKRSSFIADALRARDEVRATGMVYDGDEFLAYMHAKLRGESVTRPPLRRVADLRKK